MPPRESRSGYQDSNRDKKGPAVVRNDRVTVFSM